LEFRDSESNIQQLDIHGVDARVIDTGRRLVLADQSPAATGYID
jgi:hypothetical protein